MYVQSKRLLSISPLAMFLFFSLLLGACGSTTDSSEDDSKNDAATETGSVKIALSQSACKETVVKEDQLEEDISCWSTNGGIRIEHSNVATNCGAELSGKLEQNNDSLEVYEAVANPDSPLTGCSCYFDVVIDISGLEKQTYDVDLFYHYSRENDLYRSKGFCQVPID